MINALTIDVEDYFQVHAFRDVIGYEDWDDYECRVEGNVDRLLQILDSSTAGSHLGGHEPTKGTFFVLGWVAERYPHLIRKIYEQGHEIACHGYAHALISHQTKDEFREDIRRSKAVLQEITGGEVIGYRAPTYSITERTQWAFEVLMEAGFRYDSSIFPIHHDTYGMPRAPRFPFLVSVNRTDHLEFSTLARGPSGNENSTAFPEVTTRDIIEFPLSTVSVWGKNIPVAGGGYFRLLPYGIVKKGLERINGKEGMPFIFYVHPWEIDPEQPRIDHARRLSKFRHYVNLDKTEKRLMQFLDDFHFAPVKEVLNIAARPLQKPSTQARPSSAGLPNAAPNDGIITAS